MPASRLPASVAAVVAVSLVVLPAPAVLAAPALVPLRSIGTHPFTSSGVTVRDNEGLAHDPVTDTLWIADDSTAQLYAVDRASGALRQVISRSALRSAPRFAGTELAGSARSVDLEAVAYDAATDTLYAFSGTCCTTSARATVFRLTRTTGATFAVQSWQPLNPPYNDLSGAAARGGRIWAGAGRNLVEYDYASNTVVSVRRPGGAHLDSIYGVGFGPGPDDLWLALAGDRVIRYSAASLQPVAGYDFAMSPLGVRDARSVEPIGTQLYVSDGYDGYGSSSKAFGVRVFEVAGDGPPPPPPPGGAPVASFTVSATSGQAPLTVTFTDTSSNDPTSWDWNFGDGVHASTRHTSHVFTRPGYYDVTLVVRNSAGVGSTHPTRVTVTG